MAESLSARLRGIIPPVTSPLSADGSFDASSAAGMYRQMLEAGVHGMFLFGSSGEGPMLSEADRAAALETATGVLDKRVPLLVGVMAAGTDQVIAQAQIAKKHGADALVVSPPTYFTVTQTELLEHFRAVKRAVELPVFIYDIPATSHTKCELETMLALAEDGTAVGVKDSSGDAIGFRRLVERKPKDFRMFTGSELMVDVVLMQGADGAVPGLANAAPELFVQLYDLWRAGKTEEAIAVQKRIIRLFDIFVPPSGPITAGYAVGAMKVAQKLRGWIATTRLKQPLAPVTVDMETRIRRILSDLKLI